MSVEKQPSGRFVLRLPPALHAQLTRSAHKADLSLNEHCVRSLARSEAMSESPIRDVIAAALEQLGAGLAGAAIFGSYARGAAGPSSDVDVLFVVSDDVEVTRSLYDPWDVQDYTIEDHGVEPHFAKMRVAEDRISGFWAEIAIDGVVVYDPELSLARELIRIRRAILGGLMIRRTAGGHSWWSAA